MNKVKQVLDSTSQNKLEQLRKERGAFMAHTRKSRDLSQAEMAEEIDVSTRQYGDQERGRRCCSEKSILLFLCTLDDEEVSRLLNAVRGIFFYAKEDEDK